MWTPENRCLILAPFYFVTKKMKPETQKNMYEVRLLRDQIDAIIKPAFNNWHPVENVRNMLVELLNKEYELNNVPRQKTNV